MVGALVAAAGLWAAFPDVGAWWLSFPSLALLFSRIDGASPGRGAWIAGVFGAGFWLPHVSWSVPATGGWVPWVALAATQVFFVAFWGALASLTQVLAWTRAPLGQAVAFGVTWVGVEQFRSTWPWSGFPWGNLAYPQVDSPLGNLAPWGGEVLVSFLVVTIAVLLRHAFAVAPRVVPAWGRPAALLGALVALLAPALVPLPAAQEAGSVRIGVVQGNIARPGAASYAVEGLVSGNHASEHAELVGERLDLVVWGEASLDRDPRRNTVVRAIVAEAVDEVGVPTLVGLPEYDGEVRWNWVGMWYPGVGLDETMYGKQVPVPFGEFIPFRSFIAAIATEAAQVNVDLAAVDNPAYLHARLEDGRILPMAVGICFEVAYESLLAEGVRSGGQILVVPTNNYHFDHSAEPTQQAQILRFRAMEFSRSAVQASTTGVSMLVRPDGSVQAVTGKMTADHLVGELPLRTTVTPIALMGPWPSRMAMAGAAVLVLASLVRIVQVLRRRPGTGRSA